MSVERYSINSFYEFTDLLTGDGITMVVDDDVDVVLHQFFGDDGNRVGMLLHGRLEAQDVS
jgi:hypothetical protein